VVGRNFVLLSLKESFGGAGGGCGNASRVHTQGDERFSGSGRSRLANGPAGRTTGSRRGPGDRAHGRRWTTIAR